MKQPFIIYALPRSRTAWLARFLSYRGFMCYHEQAIFMRSLKDVRAFFRRSNIGTAETAAAPGRCLIRYVAPNIKEVVVFRPVDEVVESMMNVDVGGVATYDRAALKKSMEYNERVLRRVAADPKVLSVNYHDLDKPETCARIFEHCLPYKFDQAWWESLKDINVQVNVKDVLLYYYSNRPAIEAFKKYCKSELRALCRMGLIPIPRRA